MAKRGGYYHYRHYQGKGSAAKTALAVFLVLVILIAAAVIVLMQRSIVYDETGTPQIELPWQADASKGAEVPPLELVIENPSETPQKAEVPVSMPEDPMTEDSAETAPEEAAASGAETEPEETAETKS